MRWGKKLFIYINLLLVLFTGLAYLSPYVHPSFTWFFSFFGLGYPILLIFNLLFIFFWMMVKPKYLLPSLFCLIIGWYPLQRTFQFNLSKNEGKGLTVMSYNIGHTKYKFDPENEGTVAMDAFRSFILKNDPDVICIQERTRRHLDKYAKIFEGYHLYPDEFIGTAIYSKHTISNSGNIYFDTNAHNATWVDIVYQGKTVRVYSIHLSSNKIKNISEKENIREYLDEGLFILDKYNLHAVKRVHQVEQILEHADKSPYPVIMAGDFNDVPQSYVYNLMAEKYCDVFEERGFGFGKTHNTGLPILRIDYCFIDPEIQAIDQKVIKSNFSDHYPVLSRVKLNN